MVYSNCGKKIKKFKKVQYLFFFAVYSLYEDIVKKIQTERMHLFVPNIGIAINIYIDGNPTDNQMKLAISKAVLCHESLQSKIILQNDGVAFYKKAEPKYQIFCNSEEWTKLVEKFPLQPLDIFNGEMVRFHIIRNDNSLQLLIIGHHLAGDGLSFVFLTEDIMRALNGELIQYKPLQVLDINVLPKRSGMSFITKIYLQHLNKRWSKNRCVFNCENYHGLLKEYANKYDGAVTGHIFNENETSKLIHYSKKIGISVNTLLVTALLKEYKETAIVGIPVSVRDSLYKGMANWVSGISITYQYDINMNFSANAKIIQTMINKLLKNNRKKYFVLHFINMIDNSLLDSVCMTKYLNFSNPESIKLAKLMFYTRNSCDLGVTNLTRAMIPAIYGKYSITALSFVPPVIPNTKRSIGIVTFENKMSITMNTIAVDKTKEQDFFNHVINLLRILDKIILEY